MFPFRPTRVLLIPFRRASERNLKVASRVSSLVAPAEGIATTGRPPEAMAIKGEERQGPRVPPSPLLCGGAKPTICQLRAYGVGFSSKSAWFPMIKRSSLFPALSCDLIKKAERSDGPGPGCQRGRASHAGASLCVAPPGFYFCVCVCSELGGETTTTRLR